MRWSRQQQETETGTSGVVRLGRDTARLLPRLEPGDIAVLDHVDLDGGTASALVSRGVVAVVNAVPSTSGRYPNLGPGVLVQAGVPLLDDVGDDVFSALRDGRRVRLEDASLWAGDERVASGVRHDELSVAEAAEQARSGLAAQLADLTANATGFLLDERDVLLEGAGIPELRTRVRGRPVVVVAAAPTAADELALLKAFRRDHDPVLVAVEGGAQVLAARGLAPEVVVGDVVGVPDSVLRKATDVVVRVGTTTPEAVPLDRVRPFATTAAAEDMALLVLAEAGADVIVLVGYPGTVEELLDRGRAGAASAVPVRLALGDRMVGAAAAARLGAPRLSPVAVLLLVLSALVLCGTAFAFAGADGFDLGLLDERWHALLEHAPW